MPFPMVHLCVAHRILDNNKEIENPGNFLLGALAPDAVHFRENYSGDMKKSSHLCVGNEKWGATTKNQEWFDNVLLFLQRNKCFANKDFMYGYCSHILADIQNNIKIWMPLHLKNEETQEKAMSSLLHKEAYAIDLLLYLLHPKKEEIWSQLKEANSYHIPGCVSAEEIDRMKDAILYSQFANTEQPDVSFNKYITMPIIQDFIAKESEYIREILYF